MRRPRARRSTVVLVPLLALALPLALAAPGRVLAGDAPAPTPGPTVAFPAGIPIVLDGRLDPGEWQDAKPFGLVSPTIAAVAKTARNTLLLAARLPGRWEAPWTLRLHVAPDADDARYDAPGALVLDVEPNDHNRPHAFLQVRESTPAGTGWQRRDGRVVVRFGGTAREAALEAAIPLEVLGAGAKATSVRWCVMWSTTGSTPSHANFPAGLDIGASANGVLPADFATTTRWARTTLAPVAGGGLVAKAEWEALVAADAELTLRGERAHRAVNERIGTYDDQPTEHGKRDAPLEAALEDFRWIARREPWSHADGRMVATALWQLNRAVEGFTVARVQAARTTWLDEAEDLRLAAFLAQEAERYDEAAPLWEAAADAVGGRDAEPYRQAATTARDLAAAHRREQDARRADDAKDDLPLVMLRTTRGNVILRVLEDDCPESARQFLHLVEETKSPEGARFYDGTRFHRVVAAGLVQGGDPTSRGEGCATAGDGGSTWSIDAETNPRHGFFRGSVGWVMSEADRRVRSQFFVLTGPKPWFAEKRVPCFATVVAGMDVIDRLEPCDELIEARVLRKRDHPYVPTKQE